MYARILHWYLYYDSLAIIYNSIGHGCHAIEDPSVVELLKNKNVTLEVCPLSNYLTGSVRVMSEHPVRRLYDAGTNITPL